MSKKRGSLLSYRPDIKVVDATLRDGGLVNDFRFTEDFVRDLYAANVAAGIDYMEFGYKASKDIFDPKDFGPWKFCEEADLRNIVGDNDTDMKIAVMADVGRCNYKRDIIPREESVIDLVRIATYINTIPAALDMVRHCKNMGYETTPDSFKGTICFSKNLRSGIISYLGFFKNPNNCSLAQFPAPRPMPFTVASK